MDCSLLRPALTVSLRSFSKNDHSFYFLHAEVLVSFQDSLCQNDKYLFLYSITPPYADIPEERLRKNIARLVERTAGLPLDGIVVYDVQDERDRTQEPRPFPFRPTLDSLRYSHELRLNLAKPLITYKCIAGMDDQEWSSWLCESKSAGIEAVSVVGLASSNSKQAGISLQRSLELAGERLPDLPLGGVVIPERHTSDQNECERLRRKAELGCRYFISQAIYDPDLTIRLLCDYAESCHESGTMPQRIFLTFAPCGSDKTLEFMRWLGIRIPEETARRIATAASPIDESVEICLLNFRRIQEALAGTSMRLGINVESVSARKDERIATQELILAMKACAT
jgi:hypothetical protein